MSVLFKETNRQSKMKKRASADTRKWAPTEALRFWLKFDLYPGNLVVEGADKKIYEAPYQRSLQGKKPRFSTLITTYFLPYLSAWMRRRDTLQF